MLVKEDRLRYLRPKKENRNVKIVYKRTNLNTRLNINSEKRINLGHEFSVKIKQHIGAETRIEVK